MDSNLDSNLDATSPNSSSTEEASAYPDFISSYTQISNIQDLSQHTDVDSSDEFSEIDDTKPLVEETSLPQLSSQIIEWSKERYQTYENDNDVKSLLKQSASLQKKFQQKGQIDKEKFYFVQMKLLQDIESYANKLSQNLNAIMKFIVDSSSSITENSFGSIQSFQTSLYDTCESVDSNIKLMYKIIANCEELNKSLGFIETLSLKIKCESHLAPSKLAGNTSLTENELDLLEDRGVVSNQPDSSEEYRAEQARSSKSKVEHVYVWDCGRLLCVSNMNTMNKVVRILLIIFQIFLFMFSGTILGIGIWLIADPKSYEPSRFLDTYNVIHAAYIMIIVGGFTMFLTFFGIATTELQNVYMIITYLVLLLILFAMQVAIVTLAINKGYGTRLYIFAYKEFLRELQQYNYQQESRKFVDFFQVKLRCCGVESFNDYPRYGMAIPVSCYMAGHTYLNEKGCALALRQFLELRTAVVGFLCFFNAWVHLIIIVLLFMLLCVKKY